MTFPLRMLTMNTNVCLKTTGLLRLTGHIPCCCPLVEVLSAALGIQGTSPPQPGDYQITLPSISRVNSGQNVSATGQAALMVRQ